MFIDMSTCQFDLIFFCEATIYKFNFGKCKINCEQCFLCFLRCVLHLKENLFNSCGDVYSHVRMTILRIQNRNIVKSVKKDNEECLFIF